MMEIFAVCEVFKGSGFELTLPIEYFYSEDNALKRHSELKAQGHYVLVQEIVVK